MQSLILNYSHRIQVKPRENPKARLKIRLLHICGKMDPETVFQEFSTKRVSFNIPFEPKTEQLQVAASVLSNRNVLGFLPTGYGKTSCIVIPAVVKSEVQPITLVVSPLSSLIDDQMSKLEEWKFTCAKIESLTEMNQATISGLLPCLSRQSSLSLFLVLSITHTHTHIHTHTHTHTHTQSLCLSFNRMQILILCIKAVVLATFLHDRSKLVGLLKRLMEVSSQCKFVQREFISGGFVPL